MSALSGQMQSSKESWGESTEGREMVVVRRRVDKLAMAATMFGIPLCLWYEACIVLPHYHPSYYEPMAMLNLLWAAFLAFNIIGNYWMLMRTDPSTRGLAVPTIITEEMDRHGWKFCYNCQMNAPPRSYHCKMCNMCILRRDVHCFFAGRCVGHANQRYYVIMVVYMFVAAVYCNLYNWPFVQETLGTHVSTFFTLLLPHLWFFIKSYTWRSFLVTFLTHLGVFFLFILSYLIMTLFQRVPRNQTSYERKKGIRTFSRASVWLNLREMLGQRLVMPLLCPFVRSPLLGDGMTFRQGFGVIERT